MNHGFARKQLAAAIVSLGLIGPVVADSTLPTGGEVSAGSASIGTAGAAMTINQASQRAVIRWNSFSIGSDASVTFNQPNSSAIALNRVLGNDLSRIDGQLNANGQVFITNPNGVLFGAGSQVNVGGLVASTLEMDEAAFMGGNFVLQGSSTASVSNEGNLNGQSIALVGARVINNGSVNADSAVLAAGERVTLQFDGDGLVSASVDAKQLNAFIENGGIVSVGEGRLLMTAGTASELTSTVINNTGILQANSLTSQGGDIVLGGDYLVNTGTIEANGQVGGSIALNADRTLMAGDIAAEGAQQGGRITTSTRSHWETQSSTQSVNGQTAGSIQLTAQLDLFSSGAYTADGDTGGSIDITAQNIQLRGANISAIGSGDGGHIRIGGGYQGKDTDIQNATTNIIANTIIDASSADNGNGGTVIVWSDQQTDFYGTAKATGGANSGDGGFIEVSGKELLNFGGTGDASAVNGEAGTLLLDPKDIVIDSSAGSFAINTFELSGIYNLDISEQFVLDNGNIVNVYSGSDSSRGWVQLFSPTGTLISMLTGSNSYDRVGSGGLTKLANGNYVVVSPLWSDGLGASGAATWMDADVGIQGIVSSTNSLVGANSGDFTGAQVVALSNGHYVVAAPNWDSGQVQDVGAVIWGDGNAGVTGSVLSASFIMGTTTRDQVGLSVAALSNGHYVIGSPYWDNGGMSDVGAITWADGFSSTSAVISAGNSLIGGINQDFVGEVVVALSNGNYVVGSPHWNNGGLVDVGAVTWLDGSSAITGVVTSANSLIGSIANDHVGAEVFALSDGNYVVGSADWDNGAAVDVGAVTWGNGALGSTGVVSTANSLYGRNAGDFTGMRIQPFVDGSYLVITPELSYMAANDGAITHCSGSVACVGSPDDTFSLIGQAGWRLGVDGVYELGNGNYVIDSGSVISWVDGGTGFVGYASQTAVSPGSVIVLSDGNYIINDSRWANGRGAVTWMDGVSGAGISSANQLVGDFATTTAYVTYWWHAGGPTNPMRIGGLRYEVPGSGYGQQVFALEDGQYLVYRPAHDLIHTAMNAVPNSCGYLGLTCRGGYATITGRGAMSLGHYESGVGLVENVVYTGPAADAALRLDPVRGGTVFGAGYAVVVWDPWRTSEVVLDEWYESNLSAKIEVLSGQLLRSRNLVFDPYWMIEYTSASYVTGLLASGTDVVLQATNDISIYSDIIVDNPSGNGGSLTLQAGRNIVFTADVVTDNGNLTAIAGVPVVDPSDREPGVPVIHLGSGVTLDVGEGVLTLAAINGGYFNNYSGATAITTSGAGYWQVYSNSPDTNVFGGLDSGNQAIWNTAYGDPVSATGNRYIFEQQPTLIFASVDAQRYQYEAIDLQPYYTVSGFVDASLYGNVFVQDDATNTFTGAPLLSSAGETGTTLGDYAIAIAQGSLSPTTGYAFSSFNSTGVLSVLAQPGLPTIGNVLGDPVGFSMLGNTLQITGSGPGSLLEWDTFNIDAGYAVEYILPDGSAVVVNRVGGSGPSVINGDVLANGEVYILNPNGVAFGAGSDTHVGKLVASTFDVSDADFLAGNMNLVGSSTAPISNDGQITAGQVTFATAGAVNLGAGSSMTGTDAGDAIVLAGSAFNNQAGPAALNAASGRWLVFSQDPAGNTFGGLSSGSQAIWGAVYGDAVTAGGNRYVFERPNTLTFTSMDAERHEGEMIDLQSYYTVSGFVDAAAYGNVFVQDDASNSFAGAPLLSSAGEAADAALGSYTVDIAQGSLLATNGYRFAFDSSGMLSVVALPVEPALGDGRFMQVLDNALAAAIEQPAAGDELYRPEPSEECELLVSSGSVLLSAHGNECVSMSAGY